MKYVRCPQCGQRNGFLYQQVCCGSRVGPPRWLCRNCDLRLEDGAVSRTLMAAASSGSAVEQAAAFAGRQWVR